MVLMAPFLCNVFILKIPFSSLKTEKKTQGFPHFRLPKLKREKERQRERERDCRGQAGSRVKVGSVVVASIGCAGVEGRRVGKGGERLRE
jgi:hypothetical protein